MFPSYLSVSFINYLLLAFLFASSVVYAGPKTNKTKQNKTVVCPTTKEYNVGDKGPYGWIIYKKEAVSNQSCWQYIEAAPEDANELGKLVFWSKINKKIETFKEIGKGKENTDMIVAQIKEGSAALKCKSYFPKEEDSEEKTKGEWFLPSFEELKLMYDVLVKDGKNKGNFIVKEQEYPVTKMDNEAVPTFAPYYWSSYDVSSSKAYFVEFETGDSLWNGADKVTLQNIRCARYF